MPEAADPSQWIFTLFPKVILKPFLREPTHRATRANESPFENLPLPFHQTVPPDILIRPQESLNRLNETQPHIPGAAAGPDRSEHCRRTSSTPRAQRENLPLSEPACERRPGLAEPTPGIQPNSAPTASARLNPFKEPWEKTSGSEIPQHRFRPRWPEESSTWPPSRMEAVA